MHSDIYKFIRKVQEFKDPAVVELFYKLVKIALDVKGIEKDSKCYSITVRKNSGAGLSFNILNRLILSIYQDDKDVISIYMDSNRISEIESHPAFLYVNQNSFKNSTAVIVRFDAKVLLEGNRNNIIGEFKSALKEYEADPTRSSPYHRHSMPVLYDLVKEEKKQEALKDYIQARNPFRTLIERICAEEDSLKAIAENPDFHFQEAREVLLRIKSTQYDHAKLDTLITDYAASSDSYYDYVQAIKDVELAKYATLLGEFVAHVDMNGAGKKNWNKTADTRIIAKAAVRQGAWIKHLVQYIKDGFKTDGITAVSVRNAILFLEEPNRGLTMLSDSHRERLSQFLFSESYNTNDKGEFAEKVSQYFEYMELILDNGENRMTALCNALYHSRARTIWLEENNGELTSRFDALIEKYLLRLQSEGYNEQYKWEAIKNFKEHYISEGENFGEQFSLAIKKEVNLIYQNSFDYLNKLAIHFPNELLDSLKILTSATLDDLRDSIRAYIAYHDELVPRLRERLGKTKYSHGQDERTISVLLTFMYPERFGFYKSGTYKPLCDYLGVKSKTKVGLKYPHFLSLLAELVNVVRDRHDLIQAVQKSHGQTYYWDQGYSIAQDIIYTSLELEVAPEAQSIIQESDNQQIMKSKHDLNTILYGPPGTGKTYHSVNHAVSIIEDKSLEELEKEPRKDINERYRGYLENGNIVFTTFHQSMSYEDFIEGIKPVMEDEEDEDGMLKYEIQAGIFKELVERASATKDSAESAQQVLEVDQAYFDLPVNKISLGNSLKASGKIIYDYCMENSCIALGWGEDIDFTGVTNRTGIRKHYNDNGIVISNEMDFNISAIERFVLWMKPGQLVLVPKSNSKLAAIGEITGEYEYNPDSEIRYSQFRKVKWLYKDLEIPILDLYEKKFSQQSIYQIDGSKRMRTYFKNKENTSVDKKFVLVIDEINRGNVSQIFGELITLIERDKRKGAEEESSVILPYSKESFSVPDNIFILGTMNTADRSVEALDTALRRRFSFVEMMPKSELIENNGNSKIGDIDLVKLLNTINARIEQLLDRDHTIGHSYFMQLETEADLLAVFSDKVIPLLEEYFFGDLGKIGLILGESFVSVVDTDTRLKSFSAFEGEYVSDLQDKKTFQIRDNAEWDFKDVYAN